MNWPYRNLWSSQRPSILRAEWSPVGAPNLDHLKMPSRDETSQQTLAILQDEVGVGCVTFTNVVDVNG